MRRELLAKILAVRAPRGRRATTVAMSRRQTARSTGPTVGVVYVVLATFLRIRKSC
eukprot:COSAG05_NODE_19597_length_290_cov_0.853403_1_plen_55_part_10